MRIRLLLHHEFPDRIARFHIDSSPADRGSATLAGFYRAHSRDERCRAAFKPFCGSLFT
jgi:hypothetical protein